MNKRIKTIEQQILFDVQIITINNKYQIFKAKNTKNATIYNNGSTQDIPQYIFEFAKDNGLINY